MYEKWRKIWEKTFEKEFWKRISQNEILPFFHPIDKNTFIVLCKLHLMKCKNESHIIGLCGYICGQSEEKQYENQEKFLTLMRLINMLEETKEDVKGHEQVIDYKPTCFAMVCGEMSMTEFVKKLKLNFPAYDFTDDVTFL